jgi:hypothetical protein
MENEERPRQFNGVYVFGALEPLKSNVKYLV